MSDTYLKNGKLINLSTRLTPECLNCNCHFLDASLMARICFKKLKDGERCQNCSCIQPARQLKDKK